MFFKRYHLTSVSCRIWLFVIFWLVGLLSGLYASCEMRPFSLPLMCTVVSSSVSIVRLLAANFLPFIISIVLAVLSLEHLIYIVATVKAFLYFFCVSTVYFAFGSAGWLLKILVLFSDSFNVIILLWFWIRMLQGSVGKVKDIVIVGIALITVCLLDFFFVAPYLTSLFNQ